MVAAGAAGTGAGNALSFTEADLLADAGWAAATAGCRYVLHVASPFPLGPPRHEDDLIIPAREGTLRVLRAARDSGVERVVVTSSVAAIAYGHPPQQGPFDETSWSNLDSPDVTAYARSKTLAERAAWDFVKTQGGPLELSTVNPVGVFGPVLGPDDASSVVLVQYMMTGRLPAFPRIQTGLVDVRDVADLHLRAMTSPAARGERFLAIADHYHSLLEIGKMLKDGMGAAAKRVPTREMPNLIVRVDRNLATILPELGKTKNATGDKARHMLGWSPRSSQEAIVATAESLLRFGIIKAQTAA